MEQQRRGTVQHNGGAQRELISVLGIYTCLWLSRRSRERKSFRVVCHLNKFALQHFFILPIIVTGSNAKLCFALTYCPHHVVYVCVCICACVQHHIGRLILLDLLGEKMSGQTLTDRIAAAQYSLTGSEVSRAVCKSTTHEQTAPKKKHLECELK